MPVLNPIRDPEVLAHDFVLIQVLEDDWRVEGNMWVFGPQWDFLHEMEGPVLGFVEVTWEGELTGRSWAGKVRFSSDEDHQLRPAENYEIIPDRYKGGF